MKAALFLIAALAASLVVVAPSVSATACETAGEPTPSLIVDADGRCVVVWTDYDGHACVAFASDETGSGAACV